LIFVFEKIWIKSGSGYFFDLYKEIFLRVIQDVTNDAVVFLLWFIYSQKNKIILSVCTALIAIDDNSYYFIVNIFRRVGSSKLLLYCWYAALICCAEWHVCVL